MKLNSKICEEIGMAAKLNKITIYITSTEVFFNREADGNSVFDEKLYKKAYNIVTEGRRSKADKLRFNEDKCRCIAAGLLLNYALRQEKVDNHSEIVMVDIIKACDGYDKSYDYKIKYQKKGKPYFKDYKELNFNITHSGKYVACAISDKPIGIDMEGNRKDVCSVARRFFNKDESEWVCMAESESEQKERFLKIWTFKEAYSKMTGDGIALCLKQPYFQSLKNLNVIEKSFEEYRICVVKK